MDKDTGGPAFPTPAHNLQNDGMTLRDYFAARVLQGYISCKAWHPNFKFPSDFNYEADREAAQAVSESAYKYADAMLKAREQA